MFESKINPLWQSFILAVQEEVKPALGCTEPISLALAAAAAAAELDGTVERIDAWVSPNLMKNGMGVTVPGTGMVGLPIAAALGALGGDAKAGLEVLKTLPLKRLPMQRRCCPPDMSRWCCRSRVTISCFHGRKFMAAIAGHVSRSSAIIPISYG